MKVKLQRRLELSETIKTAFAERKAIVALESTLITHGLPYPENLEIARKMEDIVRSEGAIPATIAVIKGRIKVGLNDEELEFLAKNKQAHKLSRRDLSLAMMKKYTGGTTVAATMWVAEAAGIRVFATGGIGGVHRGAERSFDISADLEELERTSVCVVSAGAKAVLDLPKTLEVLEQKGIPVLGYRSDRFPAFYYRDSGLKVQASLNSANEIARFLSHKWNMARWPDDLCFKGGVLIANPIPKKFELDKDRIERDIEKACKDLEKDKITGQDVTPYLLKKVSQLSKKASQKANSALLANNARLASKIALKLLEKTLI